MVFERVCFVAVELGGRIKVHTEVGQRLPSEDTGAALQRPVAGAHVVIAAVAPGN